MRYGAANAAARARDESDLAFEEHRKKRIEAARRSGKGVRRAMLRGGEQRKALAKNCTSVQVQFHSLLRKLEARECVCIAAGLARAALPFPETAADPSPPHNSIWGYVRAPTIFLNPCRCDCRRVRVSGVCGAGFLQ